MTRPFYWSVRRELWESRAVVLAPLAAAGVVLIGFLFALRDAPRLLARIPGLVTAHALAPAGAAEVAARHTLTGARGQLAIPYVAAGAGVLLVAAVVAIFYSLGALNGERRDRSVLFWKSLPVSDRVTVLAKAAIPLLVLPVVAAVFALGLQLVMIALETAVVAGAGQDPGQLWALLDLPHLWLDMPYGFLCLALWSAPVLGWLMLVSAWAKRTPILWALLPPAAICLFELVALHSAYVWDFIRHRFAQSFEVGFGPAQVGGSNPFGLHHIDVVGFVANPGLWGGFLVAAACLAGCVWLRRRAEPI